jgi:hypothetical protein
MERLMESQKKTSVSPLAPYREKTQLEDKKNGASPCFQLARGPITFEGILCI